MTHRAQKETKEKEIEGDNYSRVTLMSKNTAHDKRELVAPPKEVLHQNIATKDMLVM